MLYTQQIIDKAEVLSASDAKLVLDFMNRLIASESKEKRSAVNKKMQAYQNLGKIIGGFPDDFDPDKELAKAMEIKYGTVD